MKLIISLALFISIQSIAMAQPTTLTQVVDHKSIGASLPSLRILDTKNQEFTNEDFKDIPYFILVLFNPTCDHCISLGKKLAQSSSLIQNKQIVFLAGEQMMPYLDDFLKETGLHKHPEIIVGVDSAHAIEKIFNYDSLPQVNIYDKNKELINTFKSELDINDLEPYLKADK